MAKGRLISSEIALDPDLNSMSVEAIYCYVMAFTNLDRDGLIDGHPNKLWATICPYKTELFDQIPRIVDEWVRSNKVIRYQIRGGQAVLFFKDFRRYNLRMKYHNEAESLFPPPPGWERSKAGLIPATLELREQMANEFDSRSQYRQALEAHLTPNLSRPSLDQVASESRPQRDQVASESRQSRDQGQDQDQDQPEDQHKWMDGGGGDQINHTHPPVVSGKGGAGGGDRNQHFSQADPLALFDRPTLEQAAWQLGSLLGFHMQWNDFEQTIAAYDRAALIDLLKWIKRYSDDPALSQGAESLPAVVRHAVNRKKPVYLTQNQTTALVADILACVSLDTWQDPNHSLSIDL